MTSRRTAPASAHRTRGRDERRLRIIGGHWRGRKFRFPPLALRPTPDRVRETLFSWLQAHTPGARCLDLYAGSGALGLEALSRGAASVVFVEQQRGAADALEQLLRDWQGAPDPQGGGAGGEGGNAGRWRPGNWTVVCGQAQQFLATRAASLRPTAPAGGAFDLVFLDPPFGSGELPAVLSALARGWLSPGGRIYAEHARGETLPALPAPWQELRSGSAGEVRYHLLGAAAEAAPGAAASGGDMQMNSGR
jgi:16S rRNA (guanine966-N2)-methyltransferase